MEAEDNMRDLRRARKDADAHLAFMTSGGGIAQPAHAAPTPFVPRVRWKDDAADKSDADKHATKASDKEKPDTSTHIQCYSCGEYGHISRHCPNPKKALSRVPETRRLHAGRVDHTENHDDKSPALLDAFDEIGLDRYEDPTFYDDEETHHIELAADATSGDGPRIAALRVIGTGSRPSDYGTQLRAIHTPQSLQTPHL